MKNFTLFMSIIALMFLSTVVSAQTVLYEQDFEVNSSGDWTYGQWTGSNTNEVNFYFDYSTKGISAPSGKTGTYGLLMRANEGSASNTETDNVAHIMAFPTGKSFTGSYTLTFDMWMNYDDVSFAGSTELARFGIFHTATTVPLTSGLGFGITADNGSSKDFRIYEDGLLIDAATFPAFYPLCGQNLDVATYTDDVFTNYGENAMKDAGMEWVACKVVVTPTHVKLSFNDVVFTEFDYTQVDGNLMFGYSDINTGVGSTEGYIVYDNIKVVSDEAAGIKDLKANIFNMYPNPAEDILNVVVDKKAKFELLNTIGQTVMTKNIQGTTVIELNQFKSGIYFAKVTNQEGISQTRKVLIK